MPSSVRSRGKKNDMSGRHGLERTSSSGSTRQGSACSRRKNIGVNDLYFYVELCHSHGREVGQAWLSQATGVKVSDEDTAKEPGIEELQYITCEGFSDTNVFEYLVSLLKHLWVLFLAMLAWRPTRSASECSPESKQKKKKKKNLHSVMRSIKEEELAGATAPPQSALS
ncbi:hypothetical protein GUITHDRAFT_116288 [Guillardia theta CCMP2712]|uniref:Uncharacterized protein n=1 Tax=Guillardia theta (strain CCMP2712) TaxID=905079 RepID=L1IMG8_GUITC|nr:hypothetical protein GUITHDRAFT_116288 [Guillardia theta CCMP2712]EKX37478.1 hypothetical protein GUITHDRAFT_116288 [Guillardia theta CCMP2712]|eukprot:XP_005824458.1 hypothetical protein GUITHDRAFT_116288 [Guillardia theta CCMP2712]